MVSKHTYERQKTHQHPLVTQHDALWHREAQNIIDSTSSCSSTAVWVVSVGRLVVSRTIVLGTGKDMKGMWRE